MAFVASSWTHAASLTITLIGKIACAICVSLGRSDTVSAGVPAYPDLSARLLRYAFPRDLNSECALHTADIFAALSTSIILAFQPAYRGRNERPSQRRSAKIARATEDKLQRAAVIPEKSNDHGNKFRCNRHSDLAYGPNDDGRQCYPDKIYEQEDHKLSCDRLATNSCRKGPHTIKREAAYHPDRIADDVRRDGGETKAVNQRRKDSEINCGVERAHRSEATWLAEPGYVPPRTAKSTDLLRHADAEVLRRAPEALSAIFATGGGRRLAHTTVSTTYSGRCLASM